MAHDSFVGNYDSIACRVIIHGIQAQKFVVARKKIIMNTFVDRFLENVQKFPDKIAVMDIRGAYTYRELNKRSGFLASEILRAINNQTSRIAILLPRTKEYMTALIAVIRAGCAAVPLDSEYPEERIHSVLKDSGCAV